MRLLSLTLLMLIAALSNNTAAANDEIECEKRQIIEQLNKHEQEWKDSTDRINLDYEKRFAYPERQRVEIETLKRQVDEINAEKCLKLNIISFSEREASPENVRNAAFQAALSLVRAKKWSASVKEKELLLLGYRAKQVRILEGVHKILPQRACGSQPNSYYLSVSQTKIGAMKELANMQLDIVRRELFDKNIGLLTDACRSGILSYPCD
jgi:hypothetical protein